MANDLVFTEIMRDYNMDKAAAQSLYRSRLQEIYAEIPKIEAIDNELSEIGISMAKIAIMRGASSISSTTSHGTGSKGRVLKGKVSKGSVLKGAALKSRDLIGADAVGADLSSDIKESGSKGRVSKGAALKGTPSTRGSVSLNTSLAETPATLEAAAQRCAVLLHEKRRLLEASRFPGNYLEDIYKCAKCKDTGYHDGKQCACMRTRFIDKYSRLSDLMVDVFERENFESFDLGLYDDKKRPEMGISPRQNMRSVYAQCAKFVRNFGSEYKNMLFYGSAGLGKTFLVNCVAGELLARGKAVVYQTAGMLFKRVEDFRFGPRTSDGQRERFNNIILDCDLLIIDDLGAEFITSVTTAELFNILNARILSQKSVLISTNLTPDELRQQYSDRVVSRLMGDYDLIGFFGEDIRLKKRYGM